MSGNVVLIHVSIYELLLHKTFPILYKQPNLFKVFGTPFYFNWIVLWHFNYRLTAAHYCSLYLDTYLYKLFIKVRIHKCRISTIVHWLTRCQYVLRMKFLSQSCHIQKKSKILISNNYSQAISILCIYFLNSWSSSANHY